VVGRAVRRLAGLDGGVEVHQVLAYDVAHAAAGVATARSLLDYYLDNHLRADPARTAELCGG